VLLSVLDQSPISEGAAGAQALANTLDLARLADELGYHRYWVAEHHGGPMLASASPEALIGPIAAGTERIRVGSGGVMLPHYSPLKVAETFTILAALYEDRIDLGLGRASGTDPLTTFALQRDRRQASRSFWHRRWTFAPKGWRPPLAEAVFLKTGRISARALPQSGPDRDRAPGPRQRRTRPRARSRSPPSAPASGPTAWREAPGRSGWSRCHPGSAAT